MNISNNKHPQTGDILKLTELAQIIVGGALVTAATIVTVILSQQYLIRPILFPRRTNNVRLVMHESNIWCLLTATHKRLVFIRGHAWRDVRLKSYVINFIAMGALVSLLWITVSSALYYAFEYWESNVTSNRALFTPFKTDTSALILFYALVGPFAAIAEETIFRGLNLSMASPAEGRRVQYIC